MSEYILVHTTFNFKPKVHPSVANARTILVGIPGRFFSGAFLFHA